jgi:outer membrane protein
MKQFSVALFLLLALPLTALAADGAKIGLFDIQKVLQLSEAGKEAKEQLSVKAGKYEAEKNAREEELKKLKVDLEKQGLLLSDSARASKERDYQQRFKEIQRFLKDAQDDMQTKNEEYTSKIVEEIFKVAQEYGRKNAYTVIFNKGESMVYMDPSADLTEEILKAYNASRKKP